MNKNVLRYIGYFLFFGGILAVFIWLIVRFTSGSDPDKKCTGDSDCPSGQICVDGVCITKPSGCKGDSDCPSGQVCKNGVCVTPTCDPPCGKDMYCEGTKCIHDGTFPSISDQPDSSIQIINNTSENPLHVFLQLKSEQWVKLSGSGSIYPSINWGKDGPAWDPVGAMNLSEAIIPKDGNIILHVPGDMHGSAFRVTPLKFKQSDTNPLKASDKRCGSTLCKLDRQWPILIEGGEEVVADASAVDGINFKMKYELTTANGVEVMEIKKNPCDGLDKQYTTDVVDVGCRNPAKVDCKGAPSCTCCCCGPDPKHGVPASGDFVAGLCTLANQDCKLDGCSEKLFNIPDDLKQYIGKYDGGKPNIKVKAFINQPKNLIDGSPLKSFCDKIQDDSGDFTTYCYDYNDVESSPWLTHPYKMKVTYTDL